VVQWGDALLTPGAPESSPLFQRITSEDPKVRMPPDSQGLDADSIALLRRWIEAGAVWPESQEDRDARDPRYDHWAWQPVSDVQVPELDGELQAWGANPIDAFVAAELKRQEMRPSPPASRHELIRRLAIDLTGLPPTFEESTAFLEDASPDAYASLVDRMLASPDYGERWAQDWLDISHYADTHGFERDQKRDNAWRYRDYVIRAFNQDKPYDRFLQEQIAGDARWPEDADAIVATGFLAAGPWDFVGQVETPSPTIKRQARADDLDDMLTQVMTATCGITIQCARCHNHKLDPITQREYYQMWALFSGSKRSDRNADPAQSQSIAAEHARIQNVKETVLEGIRKRNSMALSLADIVGGGDGRGTGTSGIGIHPITGLPQSENLGSLVAPEAKKFVPIENPFIDGIAIPNGDTVISSTGILAIGLPQTSGATWDAIRNGPVHAQKSTLIGEVDFHGPGHGMIGLHANMAITWDLNAFRQVLAEKELLFTSEIGYGGRPEGETTQASATLLIDGQPALVFEGLNPKSGRIAISLPLLSNARFLTFVATDGGDGIGHDQIFFGDPVIAPWSLAESERRRGELQNLRSRLDELEAQAKALPKPDQVYAIRSEAPEVVRVLARGNPEQPTDDVGPGALHCLVGCSPIEVHAGMSDAERRKALAAWITSPDNPLPARVMMNRLWQHHFGVGLVDTPNDFGLGGGSPSHPELLDWLAAEFARCGYSLKTMNRLICNSQTYRQSSRSLDADAAARDSQNRWLWRQNPRRIEAEVLRDCVLAAAGSLNRTKFGPGYQDFEYQEEYAPIYRYRVADRTELWKRSVYRFVVRTTPHPFLTPLDCPDPANLTPRRNVTTTAVQSLALWNNGLMLQQAQHMSERIKREYPSGQWARAAFRLALSREPTSEEEAASQRLLNADDGMTELCRVLINANEFVYID
jgi:hypothetical protein